VGVIQKFLSSLNDKQKKLLAVTLVILVIALFDRLLIGPTMSRLSSIDEEIVKEEESIKKDMKFLSHKDRIIKQSQELAPYYTEKISTDEEMNAGFLRIIERLAEDATVNLIKVTPSPGVDEKDYLKYQADLECSGKLPDVIKFMHLMNTSRDLLKVVKFNLGAKKGEGDEVKATMTVSKIVIASQKAVSK
jgi:hypothetical protein